ncbi:aldo/keto reductase [Streptomyces sp. NPDC001719]
MGYETTGYTTRSPTFGGMQYRHIGRSGPFVSAIGLRLERRTGNIRPEPGVRKLLTAIKELGITHIDVDRRYGSLPGAANEQLGRLLQVVQIQRDEVVISTRVGLGVDLGPLTGFGSRRRVFASLNSALYRTGLDYFDVLYAHRPDPTTPLEETMDALTQAVQEGKALQVGLSGFSPAAARQGIRILRDRGVEPVACRTSYSLYNRWSEDLLEVLEYQGVSCVVDDAPGPVFPRPLIALTPIDSEPSEAEGADSLLNAIAESRGQTPAQCAISWVLRESRITSVLVSSVTADVEECAHAAGAQRFTEAELRSLNACFPYHGYGHRNWLEKHIGRQ